MMKRLQETNATIGGVILAAGKSQRMGPQNKLLAEVNGVPMIRQITCVMLEGGLSDLIVVTGHEHNQVAAALADLPVRCLYNANYQSGLATSVACGVRYHRARLHMAVLIALGDMPRVTSNLISTLLRGHVGLTDAPNRITLPVRDGKCGNPVIWGREFFDSLTALTGDAGGRTVFAKNKNAVNSLKWPDDSIHFDVDTPYALSQLRKEQQVS